MKAKQKKDGSLCMRFAGVGDELFSNEQLQQYYSNELIPKEKKPYLTRLDRSVGPFLAVASQQNEVVGIMDAASQIATLGLGFNPKPFFGVLHHLGAWTNDPAFSEQKIAREAYRRFLIRKLSWSDGYLFLTHSGAEANEIALGAAFEARVNKRAKKILSFEGSFHGRMLVALSATWSPPKREPFEWPEYKSVFIQCPELSDDQIKKPAIPDGWQSLWAQAPAGSFLTLVEQDRALMEKRKKDELLEAEITSLLKVREQLMSGDIFAVIIEPMQCEGGDRYHSARFHHGLINLVRSFRVALVYDEVQTGFHLGRDFFWHQQFDLRGPDLEKIFPDYVVCAKKAQVGLVLSQKEIPFCEQYSTGSMIRGLNHAVALDQYHDEIFALEKKVRKKLDLLMREYQGELSRPRACGLAFAFDFTDAKKMNEFVNKRFERGLLYYPAGTQTARFRLTLAFGEEDLKVLFNRIRALLDAVFGRASKIKLLQQQPIHSIDPAVFYEQQDTLIAARWKVITSGVGLSEGELKKYLERLSRAFNTHKYGIRLEIITPVKFSKIKKQIVTLEKRNYEPARQTQIETFQAGIKDKKCIALGLFDGSKLIGLAFGAAPKNFPLERGVRADVYYDDPNTIYMLDVTVDRDFQQKGWGQLLKMAVCLVALRKGIKRIQGRNRDRWARRMLDVNLSLGAVEQRLIREDYPDFESHRDVIYYSMPTLWERPRLNLSRGLMTPLETTAVTHEFIRKNAPTLINKICLSNFVSEDFLKSFKNYMELLPVELRHGYSSSGPSECVDKITKALWHTRKPKQKMLTFEEMHFGQGSFMARSLSGVGETFFDVKRLSFPEQKNWEDILLEVQECLQGETFLGVWVEPIAQSTMDRVPLEFLKGLRKICKERHTALIYNETASQSYRYSGEHFFASGIHEIQPDAGFAYLSGQMGVVFSRKNLFLETPLMLISTWDGDEYALQAFMEGVRPMLDHFDRYRKTVERFEARLRDMLSEVSGLQLELQNGVGWFKGAVPEMVSRYFDGAAGCSRYLVCPSVGAMERFLSEHGES